MNIFMENAIHVVNTANNPVNNANHPSFKSKDFQKLETTVFPQRYT